MYYIGKYQEHMQKLVIINIIILILIGAFLFISGLFTVYLITNEVNARKNLTRVKKEFNNLYDYNRDFLLDEQTMNTCRDLLLFDGNTLRIENSLRHFNAENSVNSEAILCDTDQNIIYSSFSDKELTSYRRNYNNAIIFKLDNSSQKSIYNATFINTKSHSEFMFVKPVMDKNIIIGYLSFYLLGSDWNFFLSEFNYDNVITDQRNNIIFTNRYSLILNNYKFNYKSKKIVYIDGYRYWLNFEELPDYGVNLYSLVYYPDNYFFIIGIIVIIIMGILWYKLASQMAARMAHNNASSIKKIVSEIRIIRKEDPSYRVKIDTKDEFEDVAYQINSMLDNISELNKRNTELLHINNKIEMVHLTSQLNPHFLYNTLEIIRSLTLFDGNKADKLIVQLTSVLRYSINNSKKDVYLEEDMDYIKDYLSIQNSRFEDSFRCNIDIDEECFRCIVPKLLLQPLIENSIKYGFSKKMSIDINIRGWIDENILYLSIEDDAMGMSPERFKEINSDLNKTNSMKPSHGLHNIARRLHLQYGDKSGIKIVNKEEIGLKIILKIAQNFESNNNTPQMKEYL